jgi:hypothetical protein
MRCIPIRKVVNECRVEIKQRHAVKNPGTLSRDTMGVGCGEIYDGQWFSARRESAARNSTYLLGADEEWASCVSCAGRVGSRAQWGAPAQGVSVALTLRRGERHPACGGVAPRPQRRHSPPRRGAHTAHSAALTPTPPIVGHNHPTITPRTAVTFVCYKFKCVLILLIFSTPKNTGWRFCMLREKSTTSHTGKSTNNRVSSQFLKNVLLGETVG